jgi:hypothetical protein
MTNFDLIVHIEDQIEFSSRAFGPTGRLLGVVDHIRRELCEVEEAPYDLEEWVDVILLGLDGAWRAGHTPEQIARGLTAKLEKNKKRQWPDWQTSHPDKAILHKRDKDDSQ